MVSIVKNSFCVQFSKGLFSLVLVTIDEKISKLKKKKKKLKKMCEKKLCLFKSLHKNDTSNKIIKNEFVASLFSAGDISFVRSSV